MARIILPLAYVTEVFELGGVYFNLLSYLLRSNSRIYQSAYYEAMHRFTCTGFMAHAMRDYCRMVFQLLRTR